MNSENGYAGTEVAIVGMAGRFPGAPDVEIFWEKVRGGEELISRFDKETLKATGMSPELVDDPNFIPANGLLDGIDLWDAKFFGFSPRDAAIMDPQHRLFLECAWEALEHAGYDPEQFKGNIGVYGGSGMPLYIMYNLMSNPALMDSLGYFHIRHTGNDKDFLTTRVSYEFNLRGPSINVQTACSTSLVAVHMACQSLLNGESDMALAGGVTLDVTQAKGYLYTPGEVLSPDGHCRAWDAESAGTVFGSGLGIVVLKRMADALKAGDTIHAVIRGSAINNDGSQKVGYMAPSVDGQAAAIAEAMALAGVQAEDISYIETHGTGTPVGDPIELAALKQVFSTQTKKSAFCGIGSVKTNIGHLDTAAGVASLIKTVQALKHRQLPPSLHFTKPNPKLGIEGSPFYVNDTLRPWEPDDKPRIAGVSSLGVGGTNAHVVIEEAPVLESAPPSRDHQLLVLSARSAAALDKATTNLAAYLRKNPAVNLADVAHTLKVGRRPFEYRRTFVAATTDQAADVLETGDPKGTRTFSKPWAKASAVFMFAGGGAQYPNMGRELYEKEPIYRSAVDECLKLLRLYEKIDLKPYLFPGPDAIETASTALERPSLALPALLTTQYALAKLWMAWGVEPEAMIGHSMGEYPAALLAGVMSLKDALQLVALRGRLFETLEEGGMLSVPLPVEEVEPLLGDELSIAAVNAPSLCVVSGPIAALDALEKQLAERDAESRRIKINVAAHSKMVEPILDQFRAFVQKIQFRAPERPFVSNVSGTWITAEEATDPEYWVRHIRQTVRFADGVQALLAEPSRVMLEVGPGRTLASLTAIHPARKKEQMVLTSLRHPQEDVSDIAFLLGTLGQLWTAGIEIDWQAFYSEEKRRRVPLPTYPFERQRYWVEPGRVQAGGDGAAVVVEGEPVTEMKPAVTKQAKLDDWFYAPVWKQADVLHVEPVKGRHWLVFAVSAEGLEAELVDALRQRGDRVTLVCPGDRFARMESEVFTLHPGTASDYEELVRAVGEEGFPQRVLHFWSFLAEDGGLDRAVDGSFYSLFYLAQALGKEDVSSEIRIDVMSDGMQQVRAEDDVHFPEAALVLGPVKVIPQEFSNIRCRSIDLSPQDLTSRNGNYPLPKILTELDAEGPDDVVAFRSGARYIQAFERVRTPKTGEEKPRLREGGVYLITGGMGGIGLTLARYLASEVQAKLVLVGRTALPSRDVWDTVLASSATPVSLTRCIREVRALEALGADVLTVAADVTDRAQLAEAVRQAEKQFGEINGVIHGAGVLDDGLILGKSVESARAVLAPKVQGTRVLDEVFTGRDLDFFVLFSSTSSILGAAGQVDYTAANAYLNAFASHRMALTNQFTTAINWGMWRDVGMAAAAAGQDRGAGEPELKGGSALEHAYFSRLFTVGQDEKVIVADFRIDETWVLDEHRLATGEAILPGTMYMEMARAAMEQVTGTASVTIQDVYFLVPIQIEAGETREVRIKLKCRDGGYDFAVVSRSGAEWIEHAGGKLSAGDGILRTHDIENVRARCSVLRSEFTSESQPVQSALNFGPRWKNLRQVNYGSNEALAVLELGDNFESDLTRYPLHPALLDIATSAGLPLIDGFNPAEDFFVPLSYRALRFKAPLTKRVYSHICFRDDKKTNKEVAVFDVTITDEEHRVLVEIDGYVMRHVSDAAVMTQKGGWSAAPAQNITSASEALVARLAHAITPAEGSTAFRHVLSAERFAQIIISSIDLHKLIDETRSTQSSGKADIQNAHSDAAYEPPRDNVEEVLVDLWQTMLGVDPVGIKDDFFALGGHSLIAVRLFARIQKKFGVDLSLATLFQAPTIEGCAAIIRDELGLEFKPRATQETTNNDAGEVSIPDAAVAPSGDGAAAAVKAPSRSVSNWSPLVPIQRQGTKTPFFCVHGAGGNVLNFRDLSIYLGQDQPFYGLQARGVDGKLTPHERIEDMAGEYVRAIRTVQSHGPYILGGYSGGGVIAYEMAQQLASVGERVETVVFLDTFYPRLPKSQTTKLSKVGFHLKGLVTRGTAHLDELKKFRAQHRAFMERKQMLKQYLQEREQLPYDLREIVMTEGFHSAADKYEVKPYSGRVVLLTAKDRPISLRQVPGHLGWGGIAERLEIHQIPGDHDNLVLEPNVKILAEHLRNVLHSVHQDLVPV